jgi:FMN-dependent oxidoreductase (nitrilotriacetate monooxygenase family)
LHRRSIASVKQEHEMGKFHLGWFLGPGITVQGWDAPGYAASYDWTKPDIFQDGVRALERACFDFVILEDTGGVPNAYQNSMNYYLKTATYTPKFDPAVLTPYLLMATKKIGIATTLTTTFYPPWLLARQIATLDHYSNGRMGWNIVTANSDAVAQNFGYDKQFEHDQRYDMADEYMDLVKQLWEAWQPDAVVQDLTTNTFIDPSKVKAVNFQGKYYKSRGPLNVPRSPQTAPLYVAPGGSPRGRQFGARNAEVVLAGGDTVASMKEYRNDVRRQAAALGRDPDKVKMMFICAPVVTKDRKAAEEYKANLPKMRAEGLEKKLAVMSFLLGVDFSKIDLDTPLPEIRSNGTLTVLKAFKNAGPGATLRDVATRPEGWDLIGTAEDCASQMQEAMEEIGGDGFLVVGPLVPRYVTSVVEELVPVLQRRGLTRTEYSHEHLRDNVMAF